MNLQLTSLGTRKPGMWLQIRAVVRKVRWMSQDRGKRGGARIVYFYHSSEMPLFLLEAVANDGPDNFAEGLTYEQKYQESNGSIPWP